jgi:hypothetical protein
MEMTDEVGVSKKVSNALVPVGTGCLTSLYTLGASIYVDQQVHKNIAEVSVETRYTVRYAWLRYTTPT